MSTNPHPTMLCMPTTTGEDIPHQCSVVVIATKIYESLLMRCAQHCPWGVPNNMAKACHRSYMGVSYYAYYA